MNSKSTLKLIIIGQLLSGLGFSAFAAGGGVQYFDVNGASSGFGSPSATGLYDLAGTTLATDGIDFINKDYSCRALLCHLEKIAYARCTHTNEHFNKF